MRSLPILVLLFSACAPFLCDEPGAEPSGGPVLLACGDDFTISAFEGAVKNDAGGNRLVEPGVVIFHTDRKTGKSTWLIRTGTFEVPTRRVSYSVSRLLGLCQTDTHLAAAVYVAPRVWTRPPIDPPADVGAYRLVVFEKATGRKTSDVVLDLPNGPPERVPEETIGLGVIRETERGYVILGTHFPEK